MRYFEKYVSNTLAGSADQTFFTTANKDCEYTGRAFYKVFCGGRMNYSFLFSNMTDASFPKVSEPNDPCEKWTILDMGVGVVKAPENVIDKDAFADIEISDMQQVTFGGKETRVVQPGEFFTTDEVELCAEKGDFLCIEITFKGTKIPYHEESQIPIYVYEDGNFVYNKKMPLPGMIGSERNVKKRIAFLGDSITQGIGATFNSYNHWCAKIAEALGDEYSFWNLGIGYARAADAATDGAWLFKAKQCDFVSVCLGVNDISQGRSADEVNNHLKTVIAELKRSNVKVGIFTPFPFNWTGEKLDTWNEVCRYIKEELSKECEYCFDTACYVGLEGEPNTAKYGGHPNDEGCAVLASGFLEFIRENNFRF